MMPLDTRTRTSKFLVSFLLICFISLTGCTPAGSTAAGQTAEPIPTLADGLPAASPTVPAPSVVTATPFCSNNLGFLQDVTIPDNTPVAPGLPVVKQWLVINSGTCNWSADYRLRFIQGDRMGAAPEYALYPARAGSQATLEIVFTAPAGSGTYVSEWQAYDPGGLPFGDSFFIKIVVTP
jgi:hypothetical protein